MIVDMINNKKLNSIVTELFTRGRKLNIFLAFIELKQTAINNSSDIKSFLRH